MQRLYPPEFRQRALGLVRSAWPVPEGSGLLGIAESCLRRLKKQDPASYWGLEPGTSRAGSERRRPAKDLRPLHRRAGRRRQPAHHRCPRNQGHPAQTGGRERRRQRRRHLERRRSRCRLLKGHKGPDRGVKAQPPDAAVRARPCVASPPAPRARTHSGRRRPEIEPRSAYVLVSGGWLGQEERAVKPLTFPGCPPASAFECMCDDLIVLGRWFHQDHSGGQFGGRMPHAES